MKKRSFTPRTMASAVLRQFTANRFIYLGFGILATVVGMAVGHFVASLLVPASSPVLAVGSTVIDHTPHQLKDYAIRKYGTNDKTILLGSVLAGVIVFAAIAGLLTLKRFVYGATMLVVLVVIAGAAALTRPAADLEFLVPSLFTVVAGVGTLYLLDRSRRPALAKDAATTAEAGTTPPRATRRAVLVTSAGAAAIAGVAGGAGKLIADQKAKAENITLPVAADPAPPLPLDISKMYPGITPLRISNADFYKVDTRLDTPIINSKDWSLTIDGDVDNKVTFSFDDILAMPMIERDITLTCVSNSVGGNYIGSARWLGVPLKTLLDKAGVANTKADQLVATDYQGMTIGTPYDLATDGRDAMLAIGMNGEQLPRKHGFPARIVIPGLYGFISATKWVEKLTLTTYADTQVYWTQKDWATQAPIKISCRIDTPRAVGGTPVTAGATFIGGVAWAQESGGVKKVQVQIDAGGWKDATLGPDVNSDYWRQWHFPWKADSGLHRIQARVIDGDGETQSAVRALPFPNGSSGIQELLVSVG